MVCRRCSNYIFIIDLTLYFSGLGKDNCKTRRESFKFWNIRDFTVILALLWCRGTIKAIPHLRQISNFNWQNTMHFYEIQRQNFIADIPTNCDTIDNDKTSKTDGIDIIFYNRMSEWVIKFNGLLGDIRHQGPCIHLFHNMTKLGLYNKKAE